MITESKVGKSFLLFGRMIFDCSRDEGGRATDSLAFLANYWHELLDYDLLDST